MKWLRTHWRLWLSITVGWTLIGLAYALNYSIKAYLYVEIFEKRPGKIAMMVWELPYWFLWAMLSPFVFWLTRRFRLESGHLLRNSLVHLAACPTLALVHRAVYLPICWALDVEAYRSLSLAQLYSKYFFFNLPNGVLCYVTILLAGTYYRYYQDEEMKISRLETEREEAQHRMTRAKLQAVKMRLQPHLLFNILSKISALIYEDPDAAEKVLAQLGDFLRLTRDDSGAEEITLREESEFVRRYLDMQMVRFPERLSVLIEIADDTEEAMVPNLILQPIVENAIQHGIETRRGNGRIEIHSRRENGWLRLEVTDNGPGLRAATTDQRPKRGLGFPITRERLEGLYPDHHKFLLTDALEGGLQVVLEIPFRLSSTTATEQTSTT